MNALSSGDTAHVVKPQEETIEKQVDALIDVDSNFLFGLFGREATGQFTTKPLSHDRSDDDSSDEYEESLDQELAQESA